MSKLHRRIEKLEAARGPLPILVIYEVDGVYWTNGNQPVDYRACLDPDYQGNRRITAGELAELDKTHRVILVTYREVKNYGQPDQQEAGEG